MLIIALILNLSVRFFARRLAQNDIFEFCNTLGRAGLKPVLPFLMIVFTAAILTGSCFLKCLSSFLKEKYAINIAPSESNHPKPDNSYPTLEMSKIIERYKQVLYS